MRPERLYPKKFQKEVNYCMRWRGRLIKSCFKTSKRGRLSKYPDGIILLMLSLQVIWKFSSGEIEDLVDFTVMVYVKLCCTGEREVR